MHEQHQYVLLVSCGEGDDMDHTHTHEDKCAYSRISDITDQHAHETAERRSQNRHAILKSRCACGSRNAHGMLFEATPKMVGP